MSQLLITTLLAAAMIMFEPSLCWVDITSDALLKSSVSQANTNYVATFVLMFSDPFYCPIVLGQSRLNKVKKIKKHAALFFQ